MRTSTLICSVPPSAHELALLDYAQKLGLRFRADCGNFVEENRALIGDLEEALLDATALVKAPLTWPNSCDSSKSTGIEPVLTGTKALSARVEAE